MGTRNRGRRRERRATRRVVVLPRPVLSPNGTNDSGIPERVLEATREVDPVLDKRSTAPVRSTDVDRDDHRNATAPERDPRRDGVTDHANAVQPSDRGLASKFPVMRSFRVESRVRRAGLPSAGLPHPLQKWVDLVRRAHNSRRLVEHLSSWLDNNPSDSRRVDVAQLLATQQAYFDDLVQQIAPTALRRPTVMAPTGLDQSPDGPKTPTRAETLANPGPDGKWASECPSGTLRAYPAAPAPGRNPVAGSAGGPR